MAILLFDDFEYEANKTGTPNAEACVDTGPWDEVNSLNSDAVHGCGYLYTVTSIPGFSGSFPGQSSTRVLCSEHLPLTNDCYQGQPGCIDHGGRWLQSDTFLGYGSTVLGYLPANVWIQFWMYPQYYGSQLSKFHRGKFLYSCADSPPFFTCLTGHMDWLGVFVDYSSAASMYDTWELGTEPTGSLYYAIDTQGHATYNDGENEPTDTLGYNQGGAKGAGLFAPNQWCLVRMNYDMRNVNVPIFRMWRRKQSEPALYLYAEWIGGTTPYLTWTAGYPDGQRWVTVLQMNDCYDMWMYFDDFCIAESEGDLPTYEGSSSNTESTKMVWS